MFNLIEFLKNIFFPKKAASELVDNLKNSSELTNDQTHMLGNLLKLGNIQIRDIMVPRADIVSINIDSDLSNTHMLGSVLYTDYIHIFQLSGMILLVAMIGAIVLTYRKREGVKRQDYFTQVGREREDSIKIVEVESGKGINLDD